MFARFKFPGIRGKKKKPEDEEKPELTAGNSGLSDEMLEFAQSKFVALNIKKSSILRSELETVLRLLGQNPTVTDVEEKLTELDIDLQKDSYTFGEFAHLWAMYIREGDSEEAILQKAFQFFDRDGNGVISCAEFKTVMQELGDPLSDDECQLFIQLVDKNNDGEVQYEEFLQALKAEGDNLGLDGMLKELERQKLMKQGSVVAAEG